jgi:hypothetical protein
LKRPRFHTERPLCSAHRAQVLVSPPPEFSHRTKLEVSLHLPTKLATFRAAVNYNFPHFSLDRAESADIIRLPYKCARGNVSAWQAPFTAQKSQLGDGARY